MDGIANNIVSFGAPIIPDWLSYTHTDPVTVSIISAINSVPKARIFLIILAEFLFQNRPK